MDANHEVAADSRISKLSLQQTGTRDQVLGPKATGKRLYRGIRDHHQERRKTGADHQKKQVAEFARTSFRETGGWSQARAAGLSGPRPE